MIKCSFLSLQIACILTFSYTVYLTSTQKLVWRNPVKLWRIFLKSQKSTGKIRRSQAHI